MSCAVSIHGVSRKKSFFFLMVKLMFTRYLISIMNIVCTHLFDNCMYSSSMKIVSFLLRLKGEFDDNLSLDFLIFK